jgi:hypothetical protein
MSVPGIIDSKQAEYLHDYIISTLPEGEEWILMDSGKRRSTKTKPPVAGSTILESQLKTPVTPTAVHSEKTGLLRTILEWNNEVSTSHV